MRAFGCDRPVPPVLGPEGTDGERRGIASLDQVSPSRRYKERSPPLPVLSVHTIFYLVDTITSFDGPDAYAKVDT